MGGRVFPSLARNPTGQEVTAFAADFAAIAAFFNFVLLIGIQSPGGHAMPRTQMSGQAPFCRRIAARIRSCSSGCR